MSEDRQEESPGSPEWRVPGDEQLKTDAYHVWKPRPLLRSVHWKPVPAPAREAAAGSYDVFIDQRVFRSVHEHVWAAAPGETPMGFLVGDLCEDPDTGRRYVLVSAAVPSKFPLVEEGSDQIPGEALVAMQLEVDRRRGVLAGWYHRHAAGPVALTDDDVRTHERHFPEPWQVALLFVTDHAEPAGGCFRRSHAGLAGDVPLPFFEMVSNESLLPRGLRRSHMDWLNVETVDLIDLDPPARPEPPPEPEPEALLADVLPAAADPVVEDAPEVEPAADVEAIADLDNEPEVNLEPEADVEAVADLDDEPEVNLEPEADVDLIADLDDEPAGDLEPGEDLEPEASVPESDVLDELLARDEVLAELETEETELTLPVLEEPADLATEPAGEVDLELPEPGWDAGSGGDRLAAATVDDVDLDSFVTEVETADVAAQVDEPVDLEAIQPGWDAVETEDGPVESSGVDVTPDFGDDLETAPEFRTPEEDEDEEVAGAEEPLAPVAVQETATRKPAISRRRRRPLLVGGLLVAVAIIVSLAVFGLPSRSPSGEAEATGVMPGAGSGDTDGQTGAPAEPPVEGAEGTTVDEPVDALAAADSSAPSISLAELEQLGDDLLESISRYYGRAVAVDGGEATCSELQLAYVEVEDRWIGYNVQGRARFRGRLPDELATRDERLYAGVQDVEREFTRSGCERP